MSDTTTSGTDDALERSITAALSDRVGTVDVPADAWTQLAARRDAGERGTTRQPWSRAAVPMLAVAATTALLIGVAATLRTPPSVETTVPGTAPSTTLAVGPIPVPATDVTTPSSDPGPASTIPLAPTTTAPPPRTWASIDFASLTLPTAACVPQYRMAGDTFTLVKGKAGVPFQNGIGPGVELLGPTVFGDLDGDGRDEAVIRLDCGLAQSDGLSYSVVVLRLVDGVPTVAALLPDSQTNATVDVRRPVDDRGPLTLVQEPAGYDNATEVTVEGGLLRVVWSQHSLGNSGYTATVRYRIADGKATIVGQPERVANPDDPAAYDHYEIRSKDVRSMRVALGIHGLCGDFFQPMGEMADVQLVGGAAQLTTTDGRSVDASVSVADVRYGEVAQPSTFKGQTRDYEEAIVRFTCRRGSDTFVVPVVVELIDGELQELFDFTHLMWPWGVSATDAREVSGLLVITWADGSRGAFHWVRQMDGYESAPLPG